MRRAIKSLATVVLMGLHGLAAPSAQAQDADPPPAEAEADAERPECGGYHEIEDGDTLANLAQLYYGAASEWSLIYYANFSSLSGSSLLQPGVRIRIPCINIAPPAQDAAPEDAAAEDEAREPRRAAPNRGFTRMRSRTIQALTAGGNRPFTDQSLPAGGMITELIARAFQDAEQDVEINWVNDWAAHIDPLLARQFFDMGFPWLRPDCAEDPEDALCEGFLFSDPLFETLILLFVRNDSDFLFETDAEIEGRRICRPAGYPTHDLDEGGRNWLAEDKILLLRPRSIRECFDMLSRGVADAVAVNEFLGRQTASDMGLVGEVSALPRALSTQTLHVIIQRTNPRATVTLYKLNEALAEMFDNGEYQEIVAKHLAGFWQDNQ